MTIWFIKPRDPMIFRDGRPFTSDPGARATTLPFPYPSTIAGATRTISVPHPQPREFSDTLVEQLRKKSIRGPILCDLFAANDDSRWYLPAPADALILKVEKRSDMGGINRKSTEMAKCANRKWLQPLKIPDRSQTNLPSGLKHVVIGALKPSKEKVHPRSPAFWAWEDYKSWLIAPGESVIEDIDKFGIRGLVREFRTHVQINPGTQTAEPGALFLTSGLEFTHSHIWEDKLLLETAREFSLAIDTDADISNRWGYVGGERRIAVWEKREEIQFPSCPLEVKSKIIESAHCRLILLTPADFENGYLPTEMLNWAGVQAEIKAAAVPRYQTVSGWDYKKRKPKATRRLAPAGSVYFLALKGGRDEILNFVEAVWMHNISDGEQKRKDGFGLAVLGTWDGSLPVMEVPHE